MKSKAYVALDLGAESGRAMLGELRDGRLTLTELHRFTNVPVRLPTGAHWNLLELWHNVSVGVRKAAEHCRANGLELVSVGVDTWGVDYGLLTRSGELLGVPYCYRDERNAPAMRAVLERLGGGRLYEATGIQFMPFNTIFQLAATRASCPELLDRADRLVFLPDLLHYFLTGVAVNESTIASTSQMVNPRGDASVAGSSATGVWANDLLAELGLPTSMLGEIVPPGRRIGPVLPALAAEWGLERPVWVTAPACHDTASAVSAVPASGGEGWSYLSSGTWSLMGVELAGPLITEAAREANFTNERAACGAIRFLRNGAGLWLVQQLRASLAARGYAYDYAQLTQLAAEAKPFAMRLDPEYEPFASAGRMFEKMQEFAAATGQTLPESPGELVRSCLEGLAESYKKTQADMARLTGRRIDTIHIVGGGSRNELLNQMTADATGCTVVAGPTEATAAGNVLIQALGDGELATAQDIRTVVAKSFQPTVYQPRR
ncbi:MAG: rhamnulokinase [Phycisphaerae bacterium]|nr:rhamnulokinase [Phycisphaerae bacterium]